MERAIAETARRQGKTVGTQRGTWHNAQGAWKKSVKDIMEGARRMPTKGKGKKVAEPKLAFGAEVARLSPAALSSKAEAAGVSNARARQKLGVRGGGPLCAIS